MVLHHLRNATFVIESDEKFILVDPMLGKKGSGLPFSIIRFKPKRNPIVELPNNTEDILSKVTHCLITHLHPDHFDKEAERFLKSQRIPVICSKKDSKVLKKRELNIIQTVDYWQTEAFLEGQITGIPALHGYGFISKLMGNVMGFYIELPDDKSLYISADTIYTNDVHRVLKELKPEISVLACGTAQLDICSPLLMHLDDLIKFIGNAPDKVYANHLEALNHCPTSRRKLKEAINKSGFTKKVLVPEDGVSLNFDIQIKE